MNGRSTRQMRRAQRVVPVASARRQRGAAAVFAAVAVVAALTAMLLGINIGVLYYAQRSLQKQAVFGALAGAQLGSGCSNGGTPATDTSNGSALWNRVQAAITNNNGRDSSAATASMTGINGARAVEVGWINDVSGESFTDDLGTKHTLADDGLRHFVPLATGDSHIRAVRVNLTAVSPGLIGGSLLPGTTPVTLRASATAEQPALGSFYLGTGLASLNGGALNQLLGLLLCAPGDTVCQNSIIALNVASAFDGLANVNVSLGQLATAAGVNVKDLSDPLALTTKTPVLSSLLNGLATSLSGTISSSVSTLLQNLAKASSNPNGVPLGALLGTVDSIAAGVPFVDLKSLILALGESATSGPNGQVQPIALPVDLDVPNVAVARVFLKIGAPPKFAGYVRAGQGCDASCAKTAEITLMVRIQAGQILNSIVSTVGNALTTVLNLLGGVLGLSISTTPLPGPINIGADISVAQATARLDQLQCPTVNNANPTANLSASTAIANVQLGTFIGTLPAKGAAGTVPALSSGNIWPLAEVKIDASHACIGVSALGFCLGIPVNLGSSDLIVNLGLTDLTVGQGTGSFTSLSPVTKFTQQPNPSAQGGGPQYYYLADGAPGSPNTSAVNPQTIGSPVALNLNLGLSTQEKGSGLIGGLAGVASSLVNQLVTSLQPLLSLLNTTILQLVNSLLQFLGVQLGSATVVMDGVIIGQPVLVTTEQPTS